MKQTISLTDNYRKRLRDEICTDPSSGLRGEVEIRVRNKETGEIESTQRKNLIVYGGREWLLRKAFASNVITDDKAALESLRRSEILWFGVGSGGAEPGNPLQCGTTYGSDKDLYNPVRLRYEYDTNMQSNPNYASRIINNNVVSGYYKKISYIGIKEDLANPYKVNGTVYYPNLIAEIRLEISTDDICGQTYLETDYEKSYADINEAALFISDPALPDPGRDGQLTRTTQTYYNYDPNYNRYYYEPNLTLPPCANITSSGCTWNTDHPFQNNSVQYFDVYNIVAEIQEDEASNAPFPVYKDTSGQDTKYYRIELVSQEPTLFGIYKDESDENTCIGSLALNGNKITCSFTRNEKTVPQTINLTKSIEDFRNLLILSHGTIFVKSFKYPRFVENENPIEVTCTYRNGFASDDIQLTPPSTDIFTDEKDEHVFIFPIGYTFDSDGKLVECLTNDKLFSNYSIIRITQSKDTYITVDVNEIVVDQNSTECRFYVSNEDIKKVAEGMKLFVSKKPTETISGGEVENDITQTRPATITEVYDATTAINVSVRSKSYFVIDRSDLWTEAYKDDDKMVCSLYGNSVETPYSMFNRVCFSTIRLSHSREVLLVWRIYF